MDQVVAALRTEIGGVRTERALWALFFFLGTALGAFVQVPLPFTPVPLTLQTLFVLAGAARLGPWWGLGVQGAYLGAGACGASIFAGAAFGAAHLLGPTAGYLWAFLPASILVGSLWQAAARRGAAATATLATSAVLLILALGAAWLAFFLHLDLRQALLMGVLPFLPGEALKVAAVCVTAPARTNI